MGRRDSNTRSSPCEGEVKELVSTTDLSKYTDQRRYERRILPYYLVGKAEYVIIERKFVKRFPTMA
jgi:hypothetical protein